MADSQTPTRRGYLSGSTLKLIAVITMLIDHIGAFILSDLPAGEIVLLATGDFTFTVYNAFRLVGRTAFPIYCFLIAEGAVHTRNRIRYGCNLLIFACISEIPWDLIHADSLLYERQNVFFTLLFGYLCICVYDLLSDSRCPVQPQCCSFSCPASSFRLTTASSGSQWYSSSGFSAKSPSHSASPASAS